MGAAYRAGQRDHARRGDDGDLLANEPARELIEHNMISARTTPDGFYVTAEAAYGVPLAFTQA
jgi:hypothetical protein